MAPSRKSSSADSLKQKSYKDRCPKSAKSDGCLRHGSKCVSKQVNKLIDIKQHGKSPNASKCKSVTDKFHAGKLWVKKQTPSLVRKVNEHVDQVINEVATNSIVNQQMHLQDDVKTVVSIPEPQLATSVCIGNGRESIWCW